MENPVAANCRLWRFPKAKMQPSKASAAMVLWKIHPGEATFQEWIKLLDERIIAAVEDECGNFCPLSGEAKAWKMSTGIRNFDSLVALHALHAERMRVGEIIVVAVSKFSGGEKELDL